MAEKKEKSKRELQVQLLLLVTVFGVLLLVCAAYYTARPFSFYEVEGTETQEGPVTVADAPEDTKALPVVSPEAPSSAPASGSPGSPEQEVLQEKSIDLNAATAEDLQKLPGIGPVLAERIIQYREDFGKFLDIDELTEIDGIGDKTYQKIQDYIYVK